MVDVSVRRRKVSNNLVDKSLVSRFGYDLNSPHPAFMPFESVTLATRAPPHQITLYRTEINRIPHSFPTNNTKNLPKLHLLLECVLHRLRERANCPSIHNPNLLNPRQSRSTVTILGIITIIVTGSVQNCDYKLVVKTRYYHELVIC